MERKVNHVVVKNSEIVKDYSKMKSPRLDLLVEFDDRTMVDLEMQLRQTKDNLPIRFSYYLARLHGSQELEGKYYGELKETIVLVFFNVNLIDNNRMCNTFTLRNEEGLSFVEESQDRMKLRTVEMAKLDVNKPLKDMNEQEKMIYYFLNCHKGMDDSKIKVMIESDGVIQMLEKRVETISDDGWKKIIEDFQKLHENEERMELQLEIEETQRQMKEVQKEANEEYRKQYEDYFRSLGYKIKHKWTLKDFLTIILVIGVLVVIFGVLWLIPPTHEYMINLYNTNLIVKIITDIIIGIFQGIIKFFKNFTTF